MRPPAGTLKETVLYWAEMTAQRNGNPYLIIPSEHPAWTCVQAFISYDDGEALAELNRSNGEASLFLLFIAASL